MINSRECLALVPSVVGQAGQSKPSQATQLNSTIPSVRPYGVSDWTKM